MQFGCTDYATRNTLYLFPVLPKGKCVAGCTYVQHDILFGRYWLIAISTLLRPHCSGEYRANSISTNTIFIKRRKRLNLVSGRESKSDVVT